MQRLSGNGKNHNGLMIGRPPKAPGTIAPEFAALFTDIAHPRKRAYLAAYVQEGGDTEKARKTAGGGHRHSAWISADDEYRAAFKRARLAVADRAEAAVYRRAGAARNTDARLADVLRRLRRPRGSK